MGVKLGQELGWFWPPPSLVVTTMPASASRSLFPALPGTGPCPVQLPGLQWQICVRTRAAQGVAGRGRMLLSPGSLPGFGGK